MALCEVWKFSLVVSYFIKLHQYQYYSSGLLSTHDKYHEHQKSIIGPKKKLAKEQKKLEKKLKKAQMKKQKQQMGLAPMGAVDDDREDGELTYEELKLQQVLEGFYATVPISCHFTVLLFSIWNVPPGNTGMP